LSVLSTISAAVRVCSSSSRYVPPVPCFPGLDLDLLLLGRRPKSLGVRARDWNPMSQSMTLQGIYAESLSIRGALTRTLASEG
jgi:hypothetical protein